jgi:NAD-dependent dihydropyrimidine dehydrogenase PreA subunit
MGFDCDDDYHDLLPEIDKIDLSQGSKQNAGQVTIRIDLDLCDSTSVCTQVCPEDVLEFRNGQPTVARVEKCTECWICVENCTSGAIDIS